jgi:hypothetical protein
MAIELEEAHFQAGVLLTKIFQLYIGGMLHVRKITHR